MSVRIKRTHSITFSDEPAEGLADALRQFLDETTSFPSKMSVTIRQTEHDRMPGSYVREATITVEEET